MADSPRLQTELLSWFFDVGFAVSTIFLICIFPILNSMTRLTSNDKPFDVFIRYIGPIGELTIFTAITIFLALIWHIPRILSANTARKHHWSDTNLVNLFFLFGSIAAVVATKFAYFKCAGQTEIAMLNPSDNQSFGLDPALCQPDTTLIVLAYSIWLVSLAFSIAFGTRVAWIYWTTKQADQ
jgi:hypothetical protein